MPIHNRPLLHGGFGRENPKTAIHDTFCGLYGEAYFQELIVIERKRCERLGQSFLLAMLEMGSLLKGKPDKSLQRQMTRFLDGTTRETDSKGWIEHGKKIGIIFVGAGAEDRNAMVQKLTVSLAKALGPELANVVTISALAFPEDVRGKEADVPDTRLLYPDRVTANPLRAALKRTCDLIGSSVLIVLLSPFLLTIPVIIRLTSKGPALFKQRRVGQFGRSFVCFKFRTMYVNNDSSKHREFMANLIKNNAGAKTVDGKVIYKMENDPRITRIGKILRKTSLDELPQLFNVFLGNMSLVGPRPAIPYEVENYDLWHRRRYLEAKPGITCVWQVIGRSFTDFEIGRAHV